MTTTPLVWKAESLANTTTAGSQFISQVIGLDDGGYVVIWNDASHTFSDSTAVVGQRFDASGVKVGGEVKISHFQDGIDVVVDGAAITNLHNGNIAVVYSDTFANNPNIFVRVVNASLGLVRDDIIDNSALQTKNASITSFANGGYVVSYTLDNGGGNTDILARFVTPTGQVGMPITVRDNGAVDADFSQLATLSNGNFVVAYQQLIGGDHDIYFSIYNQAGALVANTFPAAIFQREETDPDVVALTGGGFVVAWTDANGDGAGNEGVRATIFNNAGGAVAFDFALNTTTAGSQNEASLVALADGGFMAIWEDDTAQVDRGQRFDALGNKVGAEFVVKNNPAGSPGDSPDLALLQDGRFVATFGDAPVNPNITNKIFDPRTLHQNFDGINQSDFLWQHDSGQAAVWLMNGTSALSSAAVGPNFGPSWHLEGAVDFNADGRSDFLWQHDNGQAAVWLMNGATMIGGDAVGPNPGPSWHVIDTGDFNGDNKSDILWQGDDGTPAIWLMNGVQPTWVGAAGSFNPGPSWQIKGTGDFNGDGKSDILWQGSDGTPAIWLMNGMNAVTVGAVGPFNPGPSWQIKGTGDFNGDNKSDILWQNSDGTAAIWLMNGMNAVTVGAVGPFNPGPSWHIEGTGNYNGDNKSDILWQSDDGTPAIWLMDGMNFIFGGAAGSFNPGSDWHVIA